jgi:hypothetical protein
MSPLAQSVATHVRALTMTHTGVMSMEPKFLAQELYQRELLSKRLNENKFELFKDVLLGNSGMSLRKRQKVDSP